MFVLTLVRDAVFSVSSVGLGDVTVINGNHLPNSEAMRQALPFLLHAWLSPVWSAADGEGTDSGPLAGLADWSLWKSDW